MNKLYALFLLGCTLVIINGCASRIAEERNDDIQILVEIRPEVNYVTHLYTLAELGFSDSADVHTFCQIYDRLSKDDTNDPAELYYKGIMEYLKILEP